MFYKHTCLVYLLFIHLFVKNNNNNNNNNIFFFYLLRAVLFHSELLHNR